MPGPPRGAERDGSRWARLALVTLAHGLGAFTILSVAPLSPFLLDSFGLSRAQVGLLLPAIYLGGVLTSLPAGWLTDRLGVRLTSVLGQGLTGVMVGLAALTSRLPALLGLLFLGGFGWSVVNPATGKAIVDWFPARERGLAMGIKQTGLTLGGIAGALLLPPLALALGWRRALEVGAGASLLSAAIVGIAYRPAPAPADDETPAARPRLTEIRPLLLRPGLFVLFGCGLTLAVAQSSVIAYLVLYAKEVFRVSVVEAGQLLALAQAGGTAARIGWGIISDRLFGGRRRPGLIITGLIGAVTYAIFSLGGPLPSGLLPLLALIAGAGAFGWVGLYLALAAELGEQRYAGLLTGVAVAFAWTGVLLGPPIFGLVLDATGSYRLPWLILSGVALLASAALFRLRPLVQRG